MKRIGPSMPPPADGDIEAYLSQREIAYSWARGHPPHRPRSLPVWTSLLDQIYPFLLAGRRAVPKPHESRTGDLAPGAVGLSIRLRSGGM